VSPTRIHPCNNVTRPQRILLILKPDGVFANHNPKGKPEVNLKGNQGARIFSTLQKPTCLLIILVDERGFEPPASSLRTVGKIS
jgi:hypothetical protein